MAGLHKLVYDAQQELALRDPEHALLKLAPVIRTAESSYLLLVEEGFLQKYPVNGHENQINAYLSDLKNALESAEKPN